MRTRTWPLVPAKFGDLTLGPCVDDGEWMRERCKFVPSLNLRHYIWDIPSKRRKHILVKAKLLSKYAIRNLNDHASEDGWDHDATAQVFGSIRDDKRLRVEKKQVKYLLQANKPKRRVKERRPDQTFGLASFQDNISVGRQGLRNSSTSAESSSFDIEFPTALFKSRLLNQVYCHSTGLVVDGLWGDVDLVFPWGVFEAKKTSRACDDDAAKKQIFRAAEIYLGMLDDLARSPHNVDEYQNSESSSGFQVFLFTSCGPKWEVWIACNYCGQGMVDRFWSGDIRNSIAAYDLLCITEQIHDHAVKAHRNFVVEHLQAWLQQAELDSCLGDVRTWTRDKLLKYEKYPKGCYPPEWLKRLHESNVASHRKPEIAVNQRKPRPYTGVSKSSKRKGNLQDDRHKHIRRYYLDPLAGRNKAADNDHGPACRPQ